MSLLQGTLFYPIGLFGFMQILGCFDYYCFLVYFAVSIMSPALFILSKVALDIQVFFCGSIQILGLLIFYYYKEYHWHFNGICIKSVGHLEYYNHLSIIIIPINEHGISFQFFVSFSISF
jgi:hypothetical protein